MMELDPESCEHYPCHFEGQDCRFCFCPFYPCEDLRTSGRFKQRSCDVIWSCARCDFIHRKEVADEIVEKLLSISDETENRQEKLKKVFENILRKHVLEKQR